MIEKISLMSPIKQKVERKSAIETRKQLKSTVIQTVPLVSKVGPVYFVE